MEGITAIGEKRDVGDGVKVGRAGEYAASCFVPIFDIAAVAKFGFDGGESLQQELAVVEKGERVLARDASSDLMNEDFAESDVDGGARLEVSDGGENIRSNDVARGDAAHLLIEMVMAKRSVTGIVGGGAALAVGAKVLAAAVRCGRIFLSGRRDSVDRSTA